MRLSFLEKNKSASLFFLPLVLLTISLTMAILAVNTGVDIRLRAYNIPLFPLPIYFLQETRPSVSLEATSPPPTAIVSPTATVTVTLTVAPRVLSVASGCRQDCTTWECPQGLVCTAIAGDDGFYSYLCLNSACSPNRQDEYCQCLAPTPTGPFKHSFM